jgi:hypothetical protein
MQDQVNAIPRPMPWNEAKLGAKPPLRPKYVWSFRTKLQIEPRSRDKKRHVGVLAGCNLCARFSLTA